MKTIGIMILLLSTVLSQAQDAVPESIGFSDLELSNQIEVYPNPSVDFIIVDIDRSKLKDATFELHSIIGNTVKIQAEEVAEDKFRINVKNLNSGYYFVIVKDDFSQFKEAHKFLKK